MTENPESEAVEARLLEDVESSHVAVLPGATICGIKFSKNQLVAGGSVFIVALGLILGFLIKPPSEDPAPWDRISSIIGWWYFTAWAISFFPQIYLNYTRKCVIGQDFNYVSMNILGFACYSIYACGFFFFKQVQDDYQERFGNKNNVDPNDLGFAIYAFVMCVYNGWQIMVYDRGNQKVHKFTIIGIVLTIVVFLGWLAVLLAGVRTKFFFNTLDILYGLSVVKLAVSIIKYIPQIYLNYKRKLTIGWNIWNVLLDFTGGSLSVTQQMIDCGTTGRWNGIAGNPIKFCLGTMSMVYDIVFMIQHYILYKDNNEVVNKKVRDQVESESSSPKDVQTSYV